MAATAETIGLTQLNALSSLDGRYFGQVKELSPFLSESALIRTRFEIEAHYLLALSNPTIGLVRPFNEQETEFLTNIGQNLTVDQVERVKQIEVTTRHDVKAVEKAFREIVAGTSLGDAMEMIHFGLTSEDVNNLAYRLMLKRASGEVCLPAITRVVDTLVDMADKYKGIPMLARTHGQPAVPTTLGKEIANVAVNIHRETLALQASKLTGKLNGAVGNYNALKVAAPQVDWIEFSRQFVESLGLEQNLYTTQINPFQDMIAQFQTYQRVNGIFLDFDQDMWRYISDEWIVQKAKEGEIGSSVMAQKVNPIHFENSEGNARFANGIFDVLNRDLAVSRLQRDLSTSTEIRNMGIALGHSLLTYLGTSEGLSRISPNLEQIHEALHENWAILSEAIQTRLRITGVDDPYTLLADLTRGKKFNRAEWISLIQNLPIADDVKAELMEITPDNYIGEAVRLTEMAIEEMRKN